jgi:hypothetical protein
LEIRGVDPRGTSWEQDHATYRIYFWDVPTRAADEYEIVDTVDVDEVLEWAGAYAAARGLTYTLYAAADGGRGLIRLAGVLGDPFDQ